MWSNQQKIEIKKNYFFQISTNKNIFYIYNNSKNPMKAWTIAIHNQTCKNSGTINGFWIQNDGFYKKCNFKKFSYGKFYIQISSKVITQLL